MAMINLHGKYMIVLLDYLLLHMVGLTGIMKYMELNKIEKLLNRNVYLELFVKVVKKWREKEKYLNEFGFTDFEE